jgi:hypothetical protein
VLHNGELLVYEISELWKLQGDTELDFKEREEDVKNTVRDT